MSAVLKYFFTFSVHFVCTAFEPYVYEKIWSELSQKDKEILRAMASSGDGKVESIRDAVGMDSNAFAVYRSRLLKKGILTVPSYGYLDFTLPRFQEFTQTAY